MDIDQLPDSNYSSFHFLEDDDAVVKVSQAIFDDFHSIVTNGLSFAEVIKGLYDICNDGVESIRKLSAGIRKGNPTLHKILGQLCEERNAYFLVLTLLQSELAVEDKEPTSDSFLQNLLIKDAEFRKLHTLLKWVEEKDFNQPHGFSAALNLESINVDRICSQLVAWNRNQDLEMVLTHNNPLKSQFEESVTHLFKLILAHVRCGQVDEAIALANQSGCFTLAGLIDTRSALFDFSLSPIDTNDENYGFADNRVSFKHIARKMVTKIDDNSHLAQLQHCLWAALSGELPHLLTYAACTDDRLWAYLNCAVEAIFDENVVRDSDRRFFNDDDIPKNVAKIFDEVFQFETSPIYQIYGCLSTKNYEKIDEVLAAQTTGQKELPAHVARFYAHLVLLLKFMDKSLKVTTVDSVICQFVDVLISLNQFTLAPFYLSQVSDGVQKKKLIQLLRCIGNESVRKEVLFRASECGIDSSEICLAVYEEVKKECVFTGSESKITKTISELLRAWRWLTYNGQDTVYDALIEANFIIRKLFVMGRMAELVELIQLSGNDLNLEVEKAFAEESADLKQKPYKLEMAQREYQGYVEYFGATDAYNQWQSHIEKRVPGLPSKLTDENWARLDMKRRAEYELSLQEARENQQRYEQISDSLRRNAIMLLENILKRAEEWLIAVGGQAVDEDKPTEEIDEISANLLKLRENYLFNVINALVDVHRKAGNHSEVLKVSRIIVDTKHNLYTYLRKTQLRKILKSIAKSGAAIVDSAS